MNALKAGSAAVWRAAGQVTRHRTNAWHEAIKSGYPIEKIAFYDGATRLAELDLSRLPVEFPQVPAQLGLEFGPATLPKAGLVSV
jgi:hypothetical protein